VGYPVWGFGGFYGRCCVGVSVFVVDKSGRR